MGLRGEERITARAEEKKWYGRIIAEEMDEGKGLSVGTSLFRQRRNFQILRKEKKLQLGGLTVRSTDSTQAISVPGWEWRDELHPGISTTFEGMKKRVMLFFFLILLTHTCSSKAAESRRDEGGERHSQDWQMAEFWSLSRFSKVNCKTPASPF